MNQAPEATTHPFMHQGTETSDFCEKRFLKQILEVEKEEERCDFQRIMYCSKLQTAGKFCPPQTLT